MTYGSFNLSDRRSTRRRQGKRRSASREHRRRPFIISLFLSVLPLLLVVCGIFAYLNFSLYPSIFAIAKTKAESTTYRILAASLAEQIKSEPTKYSDFIKLTYDSEGSVSSLETDVANLNYICYSIMAEMLKQIQDITTFEEQVPLGAVYGSDLNSALGPDLTVKITVMRGMSARIESAFTEVGINQTLHRLMFTVDINMYALLPSGKQEFSVKNQICIAETVIVGKVPDAYTKINRLTDDISEDEVGDYIDFGAQNYM